MYLSSSDPFGHIKEYGYTRWLASYPDVMFHPEVYAASEAEALQEAITVFQGLTDTTSSFHIVDPLAHRPKCRARTGGGGLGLLGLNWLAHGLLEGLDPAKITIVDIGLPIYKPENFKVAPFPEVDLTSVWMLDYDPLREYSMEGHRLSKEEYYEHEEEGQGSKAK